MIKWRDEGLILSYRRHGESAAIIELLTQKHGRHAGVVRGGGSRKQSPSLQPGHLVVAEYSARLENHLGSYRIEPKQSHIARLMNNPQELAVFHAMCSLTRFATEERDPHPRLYAASCAVLTAQEMPLEYVKWECVLLSEAGFELQLSECAVTGSDDDLAFVSPKTGRAISQKAAGEWADRLLPYSPAFLGQTTDLMEIGQALDVTGYFLTHWLANMIGKAELPAARLRLIEDLKRRQ